MDFNPQQQHILLSKMGYTGPANPKMMDAFLSSNPGAAARMGKFSRAAQKMNAGNTGMAQGGTVSGYAAGGFTVRRVGGQGEWEYQVRDSANKIVATFATEAQAKADVAARNAAAANPAPTTPPDTGTLPGAPSNPDTTTTPPATGDGITTVPTLSPGRGLIQDTIRDPFTYVSTPTVSTTSPTTDSTSIAEGTGQVTGDVSATTTGVDTTAQVVAPTAITPEAVTAVTSADAVAASTAGIKPAQGAIKEGSTITAQQQTQTSIADMEAAQGTGILMSNPVQRQIEAGEMVSGTAVDAAKVDKMMSQVQAAEATPTDKATVQGQLSELMTQFEGGKTPAWAAGAMRSAQAMLAERGLGASSMAGQAVIQAAMEAALPIAQIDAQTRAQFESQNLSNRQQTAMFAAQQRASFLQQEFDQNFQTRVLNAAKVSDIANLNFTAAQTIALENSRIINTVNLENLNNRQAMVLAKASALANLDIANLNNRQQAAVQNAQNFLQVDLTNLDNAQQAEMFRAQSNVQAILTDTAAENAIIQFNAASKNQADQFFADLTARALQFNADQQNAMNQFNTGEANATARFNAQQKAARDQFNATNSLVIAQANAKWRQDVATEATRAQNEANLQAAAAANAMTAKAMEQTWQQENDVIAYAFTAIENDKDRALQITLADKEVDLAKWTAGQAESAAMTEAIVNLVFGGFGS